MSTSSHNSSPTLRGNDTEYQIPLAFEMHSGRNSVNLEDDNRTTTPKSGDTCVPKLTPSEQGNMHKRIGSSSEKEDKIDDYDALKPDPGTEREFDVEDNKFAFSPGQMSKLLDTKSLSAFHAVGGLAGLEKGLRTNRHCGLSADETVLEGYVSLEEAKATPEGSKAQEAYLPQVVSVIATSSLPTMHSERQFVDRKRIFKDNYIPAKKPKNIFQIMWASYNDKVLILLTVAAIISLAIGLYQSFGTAHTASDPPVEWIEGVAIIIAIVVIVVVGSMNDYQKERQFAKLYKKKQDRDVKVIRSGKSQEISVFDVLVGDIVHIEPGDVIPADGVFIDGYAVKCDESTATGESHLSHKHPADEVFQAIEENDGLSKTDPFLISGARVAEGVGTFLVTATGVNSIHGKLMMSLHTDPEVTPLQHRLNKLAEYIAKFGGATALMLFVVLFIEFLARLPHSTTTPAVKGQNFVSIIIITLTVVVIAVPEGLPLAVTLALAFATTRMLKDNNLVRRLRACETMGNATDVCSDKTGTLTQNKMTVVIGIIGTSSRFVDKNWHPGSKSLSNNKSDDIDCAPVMEFVARLSNDVKTLLAQSIVINSTAFESENNSQQRYIGSKTEAALLTFAHDFMGIRSTSVERSNTRVAYSIPFDSTRKYMATVVRLENGEYRLFVKGAPEILLSNCTRVLHNPNQGTLPTKLDADNTKYLNEVIANYASQSLRMIGLFYRDFKQWPLSGIRTTEEVKAVPKAFLKDLVLLGIFGIQDPLREGVQEAVQACQRAGVIVRMVTGDNISTAKAIAQQCGILSEAGLVMEGPAFRKLNISEMDTIIPRLQVLARSSPTDKQMLVKRLKHLGHIVAVTGDGTNDAAALKTANIGFSMGISGTEVAREASDIILMDDNFSSIVKAMMWGRAVNDAVKKFLQFQVTVSITTVMLTFVSAVAGSDEQSVLTPVQLMWVNLIQDTLAALALATDPPAPSILNRRPESKSAPLINVTMWKMIIGQSIFQLAVTLTLYFGGSKILSYNSDHEMAQLQTVVFNVFVWMQIFNQYNNRRLDNKFNIFEGIFRNWLFITISLVMIGCQIMFIFVGGSALSVTPLSLVQWCYSVVLAALCLPFGIVVRLIPDKLFEKIYQPFSRRQVLPATDEEQQSQLRP